MDKQEGKNSGRNSVKKRKNIGRKRDMQDIRKRERRKELRGESNKKREKRK